MILMADSGLVAVMATSTKRRFAVAKKTTDENEQAVARFDLCSCKKHGRLVLSDGRTSAEVGSKAELSLVLHYANMVHKFQKIDVFPKGKIIDSDKMCKASGLPAKEKKGSEYLRKQLNTWNAAKTLQPSIDPADFHKVMDRLHTYRAFEN